MMKTKILVECPAQIASVRVGVLEPLRPLEAAGLCEVRYRDTKEIRRADIVWCDVLVCVRGCEYPTFRVVQAAKKAGRFLVYFLDDDLLHIPRGNASTDYFSDNKIQVYLVKILSMCDALWAVNPLILEQYGVWCPRGVLSRVPAQLQRTPPAPGEVIHTLYAGSVDHSRIVQELVVPAVRKILKDFPGRMDFMFIGADPNLKHTPGVSFHSFFDSYDAYRNFVLDGNFSIGLAPSRNTPFYACKYFNKFIEYTSCGIAGVYSDCAPYTQIVRNGENGLLCGDSWENWYAVLRTLLERPQLAADCAGAASVLVENGFRPDAVARDLQAALPELCSFQAQVLGAAQISLPPMSWVFYRERMYLLFRQYGFLAIFLLPGKACKVIWKFIQRKEGLK